MCGWGPISLALGSAEPLTHSADLHMLLCVLLYTVHVSLGDSRTRLRVFSAADGAMFVMWPGDIFFGLHNAAAAAWAVLFCMHLPHQPGPSGAAAAATFVAASSTRADVLPTTDGAGADDGANANGIPVRKKRRSFAN